MTEPIADLNQRARDAQREARILELKLAMERAATPAERRTIWRRMKAEIEARSREQVARMERAKGLG